MSERDAGEVAEHLFRRESARITAALVRVFGVERLQLVEDVVQDALVEALRHWRFRGVPENPRAWLTRVAQRRAIDALRRDALLRRAAPELAAWESRARGGESSWERGEMDDQLGLMFTCCHPALSREARVALTLKLVGGFGASEIARAFLLSEEAAAQRLVRAKRQIREQGIALESPEGEELAARLESVLETIYLLFNEGYAAHGGDRLIRRELIEESLRLANMLLEREETGTHSAHALVALILLQGARLEARTDEEGGVVLLDEQDRSLWDTEMIQRGYQHLMRSAGGDRLTRYHVEAGIAACHARARWFETDWEEIVSLYELLREIAPGPVVELNRAVAIAMWRGPEEGLRALDDLEGEARLERYHLMAAAREEILARAGRHAEACEAIGRALALGCSEPERRLLERKLERERGMVGAGDRAK